MIPGMSATGSQRVERRGRNTRTQQDAAGRAAADRAALESTTLGAQQQIMGDPRLERALQFYEQTLQGGGPYTERVQQQLTAQGERGLIAGEEARRRAIMEQVARTGGDINDPSVQAALRGSTAQRQMSTQDLENQIATQAAEQNYAARAESADDLMRSRINQYKAALEYLRPMQQAYLGAQYEDPTEGAAQQPTMQQPPTGVYTTGSMAGQRQPINIDYSLQTAGYGNKYPGVMPGGAPIPSRVAGGGNVSYASGGPNTGASFTQPGQPYTQPSPYGSAPYRARVDQKYGAGAGSGAMVGGTPQQPLGTIQVPSNYPLQQNTWAGTPNTTATFNTAPYGEDYAQTLAENPTQKRFSGLYMGQPKKK